MDGGAEARGSPPLPASVSPPVQPQPGPAPLLLPQTQACMHICISFAHMHLPRLQVGAHVQRPEETEVCMQKHDYLHAICMDAFAPATCVHAYTYKFARHLHICICSSYRQQLAATKRVCSSQGRPGHICMCMFICISLAYLHFPAYRQELAAPAWLQRPGEPDVHA